MIKQLFTLAWYGGVISPVWWLVTLSRLQHQGGSGSVSQHLWPSPDTAQSPHSGQEEQLWIKKLDCSRSKGDPCPIWFGGPVFTEAFPNFWIPFLQFILGGFVYIWMPRGGRAPLSPFWRIASELEEKIVCVPSIFTTYPLTTHQLYCPPMYSVLPPDDALMDQLGFTAFLWLQMRQLVFWNAAC